MRALIGDTPVRDFFSMKSPSIAKLGLIPESMSDDEMLDWMLKEPRLLRRPIAVLEGRVVIQPRPRMWTRCWVRGNGGCTCARRRR